MKSFYNIKVNINNTKLNFKLHNYISRIKLDGFIAT